MVDQISPELQTAQDLLSVVVLQRESALNGTAQLQATVIRLQRELDELNKVKLKDKEK